MKNSPCLEPRWWWWSKGFSLCMHALVLMHAPHALISHHPNTEFFLRGSNILRGHTNQNRRLTYNQSCSSSLVAAPGLGSSSPENASSASSLIDQPPNHNPACQTTSAAHPDFIFKDSIQTSFTQLLSFNKKFPLSPQVLIQIAR